MYKCTEVETGPNTLAPVIAENAVTGDDSADPMIVATDTVYNAPADILARDGDKLTITAGTWVQELHVDGTGPEFSNITPPNKTIQDSGTLRIAFTVQDDGSGLRHDGEFKEDPTVEASGNTADPVRSNADRDQVYEEEPLSDADGASVDIAVLIAGEGDLKAISDYYVDVDADESLG